MATVAAVIQEAPKKKIIRTNIKKQNRKDHIISMHEKLLTLCDNPEPYMMFYNAISKSEETKKTYLYRLYKFMKFMNVNKVDGLYVNDKNTIQNNIIKYIVNERDRGLSYNSQHLIKAVLMSFYKYGLDIELSNHKIEKYLGAQTRTNTEAYKREHIQKILDVCDVRKKVVVLLLASTGIRIGALPNLKVKHLKKIQVNNSMHIYKITVYEGSYEQYITYCSNECAKAVDVYLSHREAKGETIADNSPLIREEFNPQNKEMVENPRHLSSHGVIKLLDDLLKYAGLGDINVPRAHGFRKYYVTEMGKVKMNVEIREMLIGHSLGRVKDAYSRYSDEDKLDEYLTHMDNVTINLENKELTQQVVKLSKKVETDEMLIKNYSNDHNQIVQLRNQLARMQSMFESLASNPQIVKSALKDISNNRSNGRKDSEIIKDALQHDKELEADRNYRSYNAATGKETTIPDKEE